MFLVHFYSGSSFKVHAEAHLKALYISHFIGKFYSRAFQEGGVLPFSMTSATTDISVRPNRVKPNRAEPAEPTHLKPNRAGPNRAEPPLLNDAVSRLKASKVVFLVKHILL